MELMDPSVAKTLCRHCVREGFVTMWYPVEGKGTMISPKQLESVKRNYQHLESECPRKRKPELYCPACGGPTASKQTGKPVHSKHCPKRTPPANATDNGGRKAVRFQRDRAPPRHAPRKPTYARVARAETDASYRATRSGAREQSRWVNAARVSFGRARDRRDGTRDWRFRESAQNVRALTREKV